MEVPKDVSQRDSQVQRSVDWGAFFKSLLCACGFGLCKKKRARNDYFRPYIPAAEILAKAQADEEAKRAEEERRRLEREQILLERKRIQGAIAVQKIIRGFLDRRRMGRQWQLAMYVIMDITSSYSISCTHFQVIAHREAAKRYWEDYWHRRWLEYQRLKGLKDARDRVRPHHNGDAVITSS